MKQLTKLFGNSAGPAQHAHGRAHGATNATASTSAPSEPPSQQQRSPAPAAAGTSSSSSRAQPEAAAAKQASKAPSSPDPQPAASSLDLPQAPTSFVCPISMELMVDPVMVATGHTYDRACIEQWLESNDTCPCTGVRLRHPNPIPNFALRDAIHEWAHSNGVPMPQAPKPTPKPQPAVKQKQQGQQQPRQRWSEPGGGPHQTQRRSEGGGQHHHRSSQPGSQQPRQPPANILQGHSEIVWALEALGDRVVSASADKTIRVWDVPSRRCQRVLSDHARPVLSLAVSTDGTRLFSGSYDFSIKVGRAAAADSWLPLQRATTCVPPRMPHRCRAMRMPPRTRTQVWDLASLDLTRSLEGHTDAVRALAVSGGRLFSGSYDATVHVWDEQTLECLKVRGGAGGCWRRREGCSTCPAAAARMRAPRPASVRATPRHRDACRRC